MVRSSFSFKIFPVVLGALVVMAYFSGCSGGSNQISQKEDKLQTVNDNKTSTQQFLIYIDSIAKLPLAKFNEANILSLNKSFSGKLPLVFYHSGKLNEEKNIVIQYYRNQDLNNNIKAGAIFLVPKPITDSLRIADFTGYFGSIKKEEPLIGTTAQPLPVQIAVTDETSIKLTFNDNEKIDQAHVISVEVLKYK